MIPYVGLSEISQKPCSSLTRVIAVDERASRREYRTCYCKRLPHNNYNSEIAACLNCSLCSGKETEALYSYRWISDNIVAAMRNINTVKNAGYMKTSSTAEKRVKERSCVPVE